MGDITKKYFLITRNEDGEHALNKVLSFSSAVIMSVAFIYEARSRELIWLDYIGYAVGMSVSYAPVAAAKIIKALRPGAEPISGAPAAEKKPAEGDI